MSAVVILLPAVSGVISFRGFGEPLERDLVIMAMKAGAGLCAAGWLGYGIFLLALRLRARSAAHAEGVIINDAGLVRQVLAAHDLPCPRCAYNLRGLREGVCPECREPVRLAVGNLHRGDGLATAALALSGVIWLGALRAGMILFSVGLGGMSRFRSNMDWWTLAMMTVPPAVGIAAALLNAILLVEWAIAGSAGIRTKARLRVIHWSALSLLGLAVLDLVVLIVELV